MSICGLYNTCLSVDNIIHVYLCTIQSNYNTCLSVDYYNTCLSVDYTIKLILLVQYKTSRTPSCSFKDIDKHAHLP